MPPGAESFSPWAGIVFTLGNVGHIHPSEFIPWIHSSKSHDHNRGSMLMGTFSQVHISAPISLYVAGAACHQPQLRLCVRACMCSPAYMRFCVLGVCVTRALVSVRVCVHTRQNWYHRLTHLVLKVTTVACLNSIVAYT